MKFKQIMIDQIGKKYVYGIEIDLNNYNPTEFDCSELVEYCFHRVGIKVPDGSQNQYLASRQVANPRMGDLGFFKKQGQDTHHVGILFDDWDVLEARGDPFNKVILRSRHRWEMWPEFTGWRRLDEVDSLSLIK